MLKESIWLTLWISFISTLIFALGAVPLAWLLARRSFPLKSVVQGIIDLPVVLPHTAARHCSPWFYFKGWFAWESGFISRT
ncbi:MAG: hypothetical protein MZV63_45950 [Marinilabiliales bacterium]|nr:hypothetical protein [Marinilabiliales bacterium]